MLHRSLFCQPALHPHPHRTQGRCNHGCSHVVDSPAFNGAADPTSLPPPPSSTTTTTHQHISLSTHPPTSPPSSSTHTTEGLSPHPPFSAAARKSGKASMSSLRWRIPSTRTHLQHTQQERLTARQAMHQGLVKSEVEDPPAPTCNTWTGVSREVTGEGSASRSCGTCKQGPKTILNCRKASKPKPRCHQGEHRV